ncbi:4435_t:CDS:2 [Ambispora leptoticha]|uniref:4435_t:CDS:1 n=1 Tax=Ambispora leptoticha TaxID=144679 RepID=A0A9N8VZN0_9GLOM|nr:4435_t:CDS:2 [Ambispora leptoticha]
MVAEVIDYRVSRLVVLCKDCGHDVGLYPARHKCGTPSPDALVVPPIPKKVLAGSSSSSSSGGATNGWARLKAAKSEGKLSANNTSSGTQNSVNTSAGLTGDSHDGLWNKLRNVRNWKDVGEGAVPSSQGSQGAKLWDKLLSATSTLKANMTADSDNEGWEGETHISRILREYHEKKSDELPDWLYSKEDSRPRKRELLSGKSSDKVASPNSSQRGSIEKNEEEQSYPKRSLWESESSSTPAKPIAVPNRMGYQSNGNTSSLPNSYDSGRYTERGNTKQQYESNRQYYDDNTTNRARSLSPNPISRGYSQDNYDNNGYGMYSGTNDVAASRSRGRSSNRQGGYYG